MGVKIFREDNWNRIKNGIISRKDIMRLHPEHDRELIGYLIAHASDPCSSSMMKYASEKYGMDGKPEPWINIDDPKDTFFWEYAVLLEQVVREDDLNVLKTAALNSSDRGVSTFAFCRLTGYCFSPSECDAYSYRTFNCGVMPGMTQEDICAFCLTVIEKGGRFRNAAEKCLCNRKNTDA